MLNRILSLLTILSFIQLYSNEGPFYTIVPNVLEPHELLCINQITENTESTWQWYGRFNFLQESFEAEVQSSSQNMLFFHNEDKEYHSSLDRLSHIFLIKLQDLGEIIANRRFILEAYLDRNIVTAENAPSSGMFWHRDVIKVNNQKEVADFSMILLLNGENHEWEGGDLILQPGGDYLNSEGYVWINSDEPEISLKNAYNQAVIFKNSTTGHKVTALKLLGDEPVHRDVLIITLKGL